ncbi:hypothetical protein [Agrobacterium sp. 10MFCol1.1]|uniref:hypothetical protein n=1 Tax=Agrobacterium sp. 10MFCol1.1 TaxID=1150775 RepID=UPI0003802F0B|nr:hypothetical protein [Agrobacterium sp. 10MFCol1.1]
MKTNDRSQRKRIIVRQVRETVCDALADWIEDQFESGHEIDEVWAMLEAARDEIKTQVRPS